MENTITGSLIIFENQCSICRAFSFFYYQLLSWANMPSKVRVPVFSFAQCRQFAVGTAANSEWHASAPASSILPHRRRFDMSLCEQRQTNIIKCGSVPVPAGCDSVIAWRHEREPVAGKMKLSPSCCCISVSSHFKWQRFLSHGAMLKDSTNCYFLAFWFLGVLPQICCFPPAKIIIRYILSPFFFVLLHPPWQRMTLKFLIFFFFFYLILAVLKCLTPARCLLLLVLCYAVVFVNPCPHATV